MKRNLVETVLGAIVIIIAVWFLAFSYSTADVGKVEGYTVSADFSGVGGLSEGDDVVISGVKVGTVSKIELQPESYLARVYVSLSNDIKLPDDTTASISSKSLLGGLYLGLEPGGSEDMIADGGRIEYTQAPQNLEQLLGKFIFSMSESKDKGTKDITAAPEASHPPVAMEAEEEPATP
ncbi:MAG: outer membrane lipid asymmetry maintenance protein MlaD [Alphaproteobacteria bacterium]|nr:outer membrane lipid asymmetry maintenance protein MlaD [Alphaproteobacteria bacterium]